jgi:hypothetical protein
MKITYKDKIKKEKLSDQTEQLQNVQKGVEVVTL